MHGRQQIRDAFVTLVTDLELTGANVYTSRVYVVPADVLYSLSVYTLEDEEAGAAGKVVQRRRLMLRCEARAKPAAMTSPDNAVDDITADVEIALATDRTLGDLCEPIYPPNVRVELSGEIERPVAVATMDFTIFYRRSLDDPETLVPFA